VSKGTSKRSVVITGTLGTVGMATSVGIRGGFTGVPLCRDIVTRGSDLGELLHDCAGLHPLLMAPPILPPSIDMSMESPFVPLVNDVIEPKITNSQWNLCLLSGFKRPLNLKTQVVYGIFVCSVG